MWFALLLRTFRASAPPLCQVSSGLAAPEQGLGSARRLPEHRGPVRGDAVQGC